MDPSNNMFSAGQPSNSLSARTHEMPRQQFRLVPSNNPADSSKSFFHQGEGTDAKHQEKQLSSPPFCREDCMGVLSRFNYLCCVFARVVSVSPFEVEDISGQINLGEAPTKYCKIGSYCYLLVNTCFVPPRCVRLTAMPECLKAVAEYQLQLSRGCAGTSEGDGEFSDSNSEGDLLIKEEKGDGGIETKD